MTIKGFVQYVTELQQGASSGKDYLDDADPETKLEPRPDGEKRIFRAILAKQRSQDYVVKADGQFKGMTGTSHHPHDGYDPKVGGEEKGTIKQGSSSMKEPQGKPGGTKKRGFGELRAVKQGTSATKDSPRIREGVEYEDVTDDMLEEFRNIHESKDAKQLRRAARRNKMEAWQASELRRMSQERG